MTAPFQLESYDAVFDTRQRYVAPMRLQVGSYFVQRLLHAALQIIGMQAIKDQQATDYFVTPEPIDDPQSRWIVGDDFEQTTQTLTMKVHQRLHQLEGADSHRWIGDRLDLVD